MEAFSQAARQVFARMEPAASGAGRPSGRRSHACAGARGYGFRARKRDGEEDAEKRWCRLSDSNTRPDDYESSALPTELKRLRGRARIIRPGGRPDNFPMERMSARRHSGRSEAVSRQAPLAPMPARHTIRLHASGFAARHIARSGRDLVFWSSPDGCRWRDVQGAILPAFAARADVIHALSTPEPEATWHAARPDPLRPVQPQGRASVPRRTFNCQT